MRRVCFHYWTEWSGQDHVDQCLDRITETESGKVFFKDMEITGIGPERLSKLGLAGVFNWSYLPKFYCS